MCQFDWHNSYGDWKVPKRLSRQLEMRNIAYCINLLILKFGYCNKFAVGKKSTNTIEGFWGQFKRMVYGTYHFVSRHYMQRYVDEAVFRYNNRKLTGGERFAALMEHALNVVTFDKVKIVRCAA